MPNHPDIPDLPDGHPFITSSIHQSPAEVIARLLGAPTFVEAALEQAELFAIEGRTQAIRIALGEATTYIEFSTDTTPDIQVMLQHDLDQLTDNDAQEDDELDDETIYYTVPQALAAANESSRRIREAMHRYQDAIQPNPDPELHPTDYGQSHTDILTQEATLVYLKAATRTLEYHIERTQEESTSTSARHGHSMVAEALGYALHHELQQYQAQIQLNRNRGYKTTRGALQKTARQARQALSRLASTQQARSQLVPMECSEHIEAHPHLRERAERLAQECRQEQQTYIIGLPSTPDPQGVLIACRHEGYILVKTMEEPYPEDFPQEDAEEIAVHIITLADQYPDEAVTELILRASIHEQAAMADIHTTKLQETQELVLEVLEATGEPGRAVEASENMADGHPDLADELLRPALQRENPVTRQQAKEILEKAQQAGVPVPITRQLCGALGYLPQDLDIPPLQVPWQQAQAILESTLDIRADDDTIEQMAISLNINPSDPNYREWARQNMLYDDEPDEED